MRRLQSMLSIDPGTHSTGWAYWPSANKNIVSAAPKLAGLIRSTFSEWDRRMFDVSCQVEQLVVSLSPRIVVIEQPEYYGHDAATASQAIIKLAIQVGALARVASQYHKEVQLIPVSKWKGQMSKEIVKRRIIFILGEHAARHYEKDEWDAVGIGLFARGVEL